jgi:hypothetical protein
MTITLKALINRIASDLFDAGVDTGYQLKRKDEEVVLRISAEKAHREEHCESIEFEVFEGNSRETWEMKAKGGAIAHIFNQEVNLVVPE